jgi:hypothetical protein
LALLPSGYLSLTACVHRAAEYKDRDAATRLSAARAAHKAIEPLLAEIARIEELKRSAERTWVPINLADIGDVRMSAPNDLRYKQTVRAMPVPQLAPEQLELQENLRTAETHYATICKEAESFLHRSFGDGILQTFCLRSSDGEIEPIPAARWWTRAGDEAFTSGLWVRNPGGRSSNIGQVIVREADLEALLVSQSGSSPASTPSIISSQTSYSSNPEGNTEGSPDRPPTEVGRSIASGQPVHRPSYSASALGAWFVMRVHGWPKGAPFPTEAGDLAAARIAFEGQIPRDKFREIRRAKTPESWRKPGPRRARQ